MAQSPESFSGDEVQQGINELLMKVITMGKRQPETKAGQQYAETLTPSKETMVDVARTTVPALTGGAGAIAGLHLGQ